MDIAAIKNLLASIPYEIQGQNNIKRARVNTQVSVNREATYEEMIEIAKKMLKDVQFNSSIKFSYDTSINRVIVEILNSDTKEILKQIPPEEIVRFLKAFNELIGLIVDRKV